MKFLSGPESRRRLLPFLVAGLLVCLAYAYQVFACARSPSAYFPYIYKNSDMHANLLWAKSIREQGWINPEPHHPYADWMQRIGTTEEWQQWWGGAQIYQQSPLYAYLLAGMQGFSDDLLYVFVLQAAFAIGLCVCLGLITARVSGDTKTGWVAFILAAAYAPFYAYSQTLLRDTLGWLLLAGLMLALIELDRSASQSVRRRWLSLGVGVILGLGYLARESFALLIPVVCGIHLWRAWKQRDFATPALMAGATCLLLTPLVIRNHAVNAPMFSTSNRFAEAFLIGHARTAHPYRFVIPAETRPVLMASQGKASRVVVETLRSHRSVWRYVQVQFAKALSLFDPYESADNVSMYYLESISPLVKWGLKHWMIIVPGLAGFIWSVRRKDRRHFWLWVFFPLALLTVLLSVPLSRYRQPLALWWIPWAACFVVALVGCWKAQPRRAAVLAASVAVGWLLCLGPLARQPRSAYERPHEYRLAAQIYLQLGQPEKADEMETLLRKRFFNVRL